MGATIITSKIEIMEKLNGESNQIPRHLTNHAPVVGATIITSKIEIMKKLNGESTQNPKTFN